MEAFIKQFANYILYVLYLYVTRWFDVGFLKQVLLVSWKLNLLHPFLSNQSCDWQGSKQVDQQIQVFLFEHLVKYIRNGFNMYTRYTRYKSWNSLRFKNRRAIENKRKLFQPKLFILVELLYIFNSFLMIWFSAILYRYHETCFLTLKMTKMNQIFLYGFKLFHTFLPMKSATRVILIRHWNGCSIY